MSLHVDGRPVALARILLGLALTLDVLETGSVLVGIADGKLSYPVLDVLPGVSSLSATAYLCVGLLAGSALMLGLFASAAAGLGATVLAWGLVWDQQLYSSHQLLCALLLGYLAFAKSDRRWAVSASRHRTEPNVPWWPQLLMLTQVTVCYLFAGLSKVNPIFLSGEPLEGWMALAAPRMFFQVLAVATVVTEIGIAGMLWIPRLRALALLAGLGLHLSIVLTMPDGRLALFAFALTCVATYWMFLLRPSFRHSKSRPEEVTSCLSLPAPSSRQPVP